MKKIKNIAIALSAIVLFAGTSYAGNVNQPAASTVKGDPTAEPLSVSFLGEDANYLYFQVSVVAGNKTVSFVVSDKAEGELYTTEFNTSKVQTYKIEKREGQELNFDLQAGKKTFTKSFDSHKKDGLASL